MDCEVAGPPPVPCFVINMRRPVTTPYRRHKYSGLYFCRGDDPGRLCRRILCRLIALLCHRHCHAISKLPVPPQKTAAIFQLLVELGQACSSRGLRPFQRRRNSAHARSSSLVAARRLALPRATRRVGSECPSSDKEVGKARLASWRG